jgi:glyoxylate utilization-related uncharacterized protein
MMPYRRGNLTFVEGGNHVPFEVARAYWVSDVPGGAKRGGNAYHQLEELIVAISGSFDVRVDDGRTTTHYTLNRGYVGLYVPQMTWRSLENFSTNAVCLCLASRRYSPDDYVRDYDEFVEFAAASS